MNTEPSEKEDSNWSISRIAIKGESAAAPKPGHR
jgi:hypothetical protein